MNTNKGEVIVRKNENTSNELSRRGFLAVSAFGAAALVVPATSDFADKDATKRSDSGDLLFCLNHGIWGTGYAYLCGIATGIIADIKSDAPPYYGSIGFFSKAYNIQSALGCYAY